MTKWAKLKDLKPGDEFLLNLTVLAQGNGTTRVTTADLNQPFWLYSSVEVEVTKSKPRKGETWLHKIGGEKVVVQTDPFKLGDVEMVGVCSEAIATHHERWQYSYMIPTERLTPC